MTARGSAAGRLGLAAVLGALNWALWCAPASGADTPVPPGGGAGVRLDVSIAPARSPEDIDGPSQAPTEPASPTASGNTPGGSTPPSGSPGAGNGLPFTGTGAGVAGIVAAALVAAGLAARRLRSWGPGRGQTPQNRARRT